MPKESKQPQSKYKGVRWAASSKRWRSTIQHNGELHQVGFFEDDLEAAKARDRLIIRLNLPLELQIYKPLKHT